jgi:ADP-ribose pyrophosphatase YjhB (NUDIX family)
MSDPDLSLPSNFRLETPAGDTRPRQVCGDCGFIKYDNPKVVVGSVARWQDRLLLCRRAIDPRRGFWTLPAGYLEIGETTAEGARREAVEEATAEIEIDGILAVYSVPRLSQVQVIYRARLLTPAIAAGPESLEVGLFRWEEIPWEEIAFPSVRWALADFRKVGDAAEFAAQSNPPGEVGNYL